MTAVVVVENRKRWPLKLQNAEVAPARDYLLDPRWAERRDVHVYNLCRSIGYQTTGYYVSLLAQARGHRPTPSVETLQDLRFSPVVRVVSEDLEELIHKSLRRLRRSEFQLSIYFGRNLSSHYDALARALFAEFPAPFLRASFARRNGEWELTGVRLIATSEIPDSHRDFVIAQAEQYFARRRPHRRRREFRYDLAILIDPPSENAPSNKRALRKFIRAAAACDIDAELVEADEYAEIAEYDALFIRAPTAVNHYTFRFARRAAAEGLVVIDDPTSILRCTNKVYQAELFARQGVPHPRTVVVSEATWREIPERVGLPCVLKQPDSSFSAGVKKVETAEELEKRVAEFLAHSSLVVAQEWTPSSFDWRIGVLDRRALWACRYHMAKGHWQVVASEPGARERSYGDVEAVSLGAVPEGAIESALRAASPIGDGLYGVDVKEVDGRFLVMEVNDNPNIDAGYDDAAVGDELYGAIMGWFRSKLDKRGGGGPA